MEKVWYSEFTIDEAAAHAADIGYGEDMYGHPLEITPRTWDPETGVLVFDDGRFMITVRFDPDGGVKFVSKR